MTIRIDLIDKANLLRDQLRLLEMAAHAVDDRDQRSALIGGCEQAREFMEELLEIMRSMPKSEPVVATSE
ncbi:MULTISPECIES: hypothetical protein [Rhizobium]|uniref:hypothetical protein n=1 Tax=Rhizobium TaxID=379 RepID=UPI001C834125|nr:MULTISPECIES: hypothetical protein [Rhizobium]MBX4895416.1 hypothetical protein [Rhizobium bangladeshense]MBX4952112.1 hypothetical protein [Rhizobium binae]MBX5020145.1 hypothetical protein [Rhizobium lentis]MBX5217494.1 hypothetical protein [Rhizobium sp. NLR9a]MBX5226892.1 hypothetical protein [Rhizobium sp. NLR9b]